MSWVYVAVAAGSAAGSFFGSKDSKLKIPRAQKSAMANLLQLAGQEEDIALRQTAGLSDEELAAQKRALDFSKSGADPALLQAIESAGKTAEGTDIYSMPEFRGMMDKILAEGQLATQSTARSLQLGSSGAVGSPDRDVLGRSITGMQERLMAAGSSFLSAERSRRLQATGLLGQLAGQREGSQLTKLNVGTGASALQRQIQQMVFNARIEQEQRDLDFRYGTKGDLYSRILGGGVATVEGGGNNLMATLGPLIGQLGAGAIGSGGGGGGGGTPQITAGGTAAQGGNPYFL